MSQQLSQDVLVLLRNILAAQQIQVGTPDFVAVSTMVAKALAELDAALDQPTL